MEGQSKYAAPRPIPSHQVHLEVQRQGLLPEMQSRARKGGREQTENGQHIDHIHKEDSPYEWAFSSLSKSTVSYSSQQHLHTFEMGAYAHVRDIIYTICQWLLGAVSVLRLPSQLHQDLPGTVDSSAWDCFIKKQNTSGGQIPYWRRFLFTTAFENGRWVLPCLIPHALPPE